MSEISMGPPIDGYCDRRFRGGLSAPDRASDNDRQFLGKRRTLGDVVVRSGLERFDWGTGALGQNHDDGGLQPDRLHLLQIGATMTIRLDFHD
jgi:hypothetical protein